MSEPQTRQQVVRRRWAASSLSVLASLLMVFWWATHTTRYEIDRTVTVTAPTSEKSAPEVYAPGYVPEVVYSEVRTPCRDRDPLKRAMFGDLHIHTALSGDAYADGTRVFPVDALRFARGEAIDLPAVAGDRKSVV